MRLRGTWLRRSYGRACATLLLSVIGLVSCGAPSSREFASVEVRSPTTMSDAGSGSGTNVKREVDPGLSLLAMSPDGRELTVGVEDDPCHPASVKGVEETADEVRIKVVVEQPDLDPETACLPVLRQTRHVLKLDAPLGDRSIRRDARLR